MKAVPGGMASRGLPRIMLAADADVCVGVDCLSMAFATLYRHMGGTLTNPKPLE